MSEYITSSAGAPPVDGRRRVFLKQAGASLFFLVSPALAATGEENNTPSILAVRLWPAIDYTRVTIETDLPVKYTQFMVKDPERLVVDMEGIELNAVLQSLTDKIASDDPYIKQLRTGRFSPTTVRLVMDLKTEVKPQVFTLKPIGEYGNRLVLDIYPTVPPDPFLALLDKKTLQPDEPTQTQEPELDAIAEAVEAALAREAADTQPKSPEQSIQELAHNQDAIERALAEIEARSKEPAPAAVPTKPTSVRATVRPTQKRQPTVTRLVTITLDPGHGGEDPGAIGARGTYEKTVTLAIAKRLKRKIDAEPNMRAALTRDADFFVPLPNRVEKARRINSDLFVSIHADAFIKPHARGSSVFVLSERGASSSAARWLAQKENESDLIGGVNLAIKDRFLARTLLDLSQTATGNDSMKLGKAVLNSLSNINQLHKNNVEHAGFAVLKAPDIPSILIETAFISNPEEEKRLNDPAYQDKMAEAILTGIREYFAKNPPLAKSRLAQLDTP